jgi:hypothetical protein
VYCSRSQQFVSLSQRQYTYLSSQRCGVVGVSSSNAADLINPAPHPAPSSLDPRVVNMACSVSPEPVIAVFKWNAEWYRTIIRSISVHVRYPTLSWPSCNVALTSAVSKHRSEVRDTYPSHETFTGKKASRSPLGMCTGHL